jgi:hypothetical protein
MAKDTKQIRNVRGQRNLILIKPFKEKNALVKVQGPRFLLGTTAQPIRVTHWVTRECPVSNGQSQDSRDN